MGSKQYWPQSNKFFPDDYLYEERPNKNYETNAGLTVLYDKVLTATAGNFDIPDISQAYRHLKLEMDLRGTAAATSVIAKMIFNNDSGANYVRQSLDAAATSVVAGESFGGTYFSVCDAAAASDAAGVSSGAFVDIANYAQTTFYKWCMSTHSLIRGVATGDNYSRLHMFNWKNTAAINRITLTPSAGSWEVGSVVTLYGLGSSTLTKIN